MSLLLNALFHHSLMMIPQQEIPGTIPKAYVMRHPETGGVEVRYNYNPFGVDNILLNVYYFIFRFGGHHVQAVNVLIQKN